MASDPFVAFEAPPPRLKPAFKPAPGFTPTNGRKPRTGEAKLIAQFRCGYIDDRHTYTAAQLQFADRGSDWDIIAVKKA